MHLSCEHLVTLLREQDTKLLELLGLPLDLSRSDLEVSAAPADHPKVVVLAFGPIAYELVDACVAADYTLINMRFIKPLNEELIAQLAQHYELMVTVEEGARLGGIGEHISALVAQQMNSCRVLNLGLYDDFIMEGTRAEILAEQGLSAAQIMAVIDSATKQSR